MKIGFIGFGEAAYNICLGLYQEGHRGMIAFDTMAQDPAVGKLVHQRAEKSGVTLLPTADKVINMVDLVMAAVPSSYTLEVCKNAAPFLRKGQIYADVSSSTPAAKREEAKILEDSGVLFADAAMLGSLPQDKHKVPIVVSGNGAQAFSDALSPLGMRITLAGETVGAASAIKLVRSIYMKGIAGLMCEMLQAAEAYDVCDEVIASLGQSFDDIPFSQHLDRLMVGSAIHAKRRGAEVKGSVQMLQECGIDSAMSRATVEKHEQLAQFHFFERYLEHKPDGWKEIIEIMKNERQEH